MTLSETNKKTNSSSDPDLFRRGWRLPIRYKLALPELALFLGVVFFVLITTFNVFRDIVVKAKESRLQTIADVLAESLKIPLETNDKKTLMDYIHLFANQEEVDSVQVEDTEGVILGRSAADSEPLISGGLPENFLGVRKTEKNTYIAVAPIKSAEKNFGRIFIVFSESWYEFELRTVFIEKFFIAFLLVVLSTFAMLFITWLVMRPLTTLQKTARSILSGDLDARAKVSSRDEIEEVGTAFNKVVGRLTQSLENLKSRAQALEESEMKYRSIVDEVSDIIFSIAPDGELLLLNRGFSGYERDEILSGGLSLFVSLHGEGEAQKFQDALETIIRTKKPIEHLNTQHIHRIYHTKIFYQTNLTPVLDEEGDLKLIQGVMRDMTDLRRVEMMKESLIRDVAHELKTPTAKFMMTTDWLEKQMDESGEKEKFLPIIKMLRANADRLMHTISSILDLNKVQSGMANIQKKEIDLNQVLTLVASDLEPIVEQNHLKLETQLQAGELKMFGDPDMLYRVFINLITNAIKFTPNGAITVKSFSRGAEICVEVSDMGIGIEDENLKNIFEAFFQKTASSIGIGVGLTISKKIVLLHDGTIWAESDGVGQGSVFKVVFPAI